MADERTLGTTLRDGSVANPWADWDNRSNARFNLIGSGLLLDLLGSLVEMMNDTLLFCEMGSAHQKDTFPKINGSEECNLIPIQ